MSRAPRPPRSPFVRLLSPWRDFLAAEASGAALLAGGAIAALVWANSPWSGSYEDLWNGRAAFSSPATHCTSTCGIGSTTG